MMDPAAIRAGIAANLAAISGIQVSKYAKRSGTPPFAEITIGPDIAYDEAMGRGLDLNLFTVRVYVALTTDEGAQIRLDQFLMSSGATSVKQAIESDRTLGGACQDSRVVTAHADDGVYSFPGQSAELMRAEWQVEVYTTG